MSSTYVVTEQDLRDHEDRVKKYLREPLTEETANQWNYGLNVLPPLAWTNHQGMEVFMVGEPIIDDVFTQHAKVTGCVHPEVRYFRKNAKVSDRETWISVDEINRYISGTDGHTRHKTVELIVLSTLCDGRKISDKDEDDAERIATALYMSSMLKGS